MSVWRFIKTKSGCFGCIVYNNSTSDTFTCPNCDTKWKLHGNTWVPEQAEEGA